MTLRGTVTTCALLLMLLAVGVAVPAMALEGRSSARNGLGPRHQWPTNDHAGTPRPRAGGDAAGRVRHWNALALDTTGLDHTPVRPGDARVFGEQLGPGRTSRAMAIVQIAVFESINAIVRRYESYVGLEPAPHGASMNAAIAVAAHDTLAALFPSQAAILAQHLGDDLGVIPDGPRKTAGIHVGREAAAAILAMRAGDGAQHPEPHVGHDVTTSDEPGAWRPDPISHITLALGAHWGAVAPFVLQSGDQFRVPPPPALGSADYAAAFEEVQALGGDGSTTPTMRTPDQTLAGIFWAYDGTPGVGAPPRLFNQITVAIADQRGANAVELARLLALVNVAMADTGVAVWDSKFRYNFWRPITGIREADEGSGPTGAGDGNPATVGDPTFTPLGAPASNLIGPNFTPPFPAYPSGHAGFGGAVFQVLRRFYGTDAIAFTFVSDELNGVTRDGAGSVRPMVPRTFGSLSEAEEENGQSRIYLGIHWAFDKTAGIEQGRRIGDYVFGRVFVPIGSRSSITSRVEAAGRNLRR